jgi:hypothetical protein
MISWDLYRIFNDLEHLHAQLALAVNRRLRAQFGLSAGLFELMTVLASTAGCRVHDLAAELGMSGWGGSASSSTACKPRPYAGGCQTRRTGDLPSLS